jgi:hypothetical protein
MFEHNLGIEMYIPCYEETGVRTVRSAESPSP